MSEHVKVSIIIPNFNHAHFLKQRIDSVLQQTFQEYELLILDDASTDESVDIIKAFADKARIRFVVNQENSGSTCKQWQKGIDFTQGEYIWLAESDDWADSAFLEKMVPILDAHENVGIAYCQSWISDKEGKVLGDAIGWTQEFGENLWQQNYIHAGREEIEKCLINKNTIPSASAVLFRRSVLEKTGPIDTNFKLAGDWMHWIKMLGQSDIAYVADTLNYWRMNSSNARLASPGTREWEEGERVLREAARILQYDENQTIRILFAFLQKCWQWQKEYIENSAQQTTE
jgi:glycosyltransferase involved in cell wall biosynthesis